MNGGSTFEAFCAAQALYQKEKGLEIPSKSSHSFSYYQWLEVARQRYCGSHTEEEEQQLLQQQRDEPASQKMKMESDQVLSSALMLSSENALATALAQQLASSLEKQARPSSAPASLRHAAQEAFPMPPAAADTTAFLTLAEAAVRLTLWRADDSRLAQMAARMRPNLRSLEEKGILRAQKGCFPSVQLLMDLQSWRIIAHRWARMTPEMRKLAVVGVHTVCDCIRNPAAEALQAAVDTLDVTASATTVPVEQLDSLVGQVSATIPFEFAACRDLVTLYPEPTGILCLSAAVGHESAPPTTKPDTPAAAKVPTTPNTSADPGRSTTMSEATARSSSDSIGSAIDSDKRLGDLFGLDRSKKSSLLQASSHKLIRDDVASQEPHAADTVLGVVLRASDSRPAFTRNAGEIRRMPTFKVSGHPACVSRYHERYAGTLKHASSECQYCATCHLMEIIFRGEKRDCVWNHWPTVRKIKVHFKQFPSVLKLALKRFSEMEQGVQLAATDEVPL